MKNVGTTATDILQTTGTNRFTIIGCNLANTTEDNATISITVVDATSTEAYLVKGIIIPPNSSIKVVTNGEKLILAENCSLRIVSDVAESVDAVISYAELI